ncbi:hypothetical protein [Streptomyces sp. NBC_01304]|uniref:hypothetical protein n=1 Tax=Streptomyces sp. NBC_01304 TaxID=2903818 RepID=UPI002E12977C|nr:hypothetical protein OG430_20300 [Streptomyces sp. NBC_01304]
MRGKRSLLSTIGALTFTLGAVFATGSAQAAAPADQGTSGKVMTLPAAPEGARALSTQGAAAASPGVSPWAPSEHVKPGGSFKCVSGDFCAAVWDYSAAKWEVFHLNACHTYSLSDWENGGYYWNWQINTEGRETAYFYNGSGTRVKEAPIDYSTAGKPYNWTPIYKISNCA